MGVSGRCGRGSQVPEINWLLEESRGGRRGSGHVVASGDRDGGGIRRPGWRQDTVDGEQRRADGRRLRHGRGTDGTDQLRRSPGLGVAVARLLRRRHQAAFVRYRGHGGRGRHRLRRLRRPFLAVTVVTQARGACTEHTVAPLQSPVQLHSRASRFRSSAVDEERPARLHCPQTGGPRGRGRSSHGPAAAVVMMACGGRVSIATWRRPSCFRIVYDVRNWLIAANGFSKRDFELLAIRFSRRTERHRVTAENRRMMSSPTVAPRV